MTEGPPRHDWPMTDPSVCAIFDAVCADDVEALRLALARGGDPNVSDRHIGTALHRAAQPFSATGRNTPSTAEQLAMLLAAGAEVDRPGAYGQTALYMVDDLAAARVLVNAGADVNARTPTGETPIMNKRSADTVAFLLDHGADLDARDEIGQTALFMAFRNGAREVVRLLLDRGADPHAKDWVGKRARQQPGDDQVAGAMLTDALVSRPPRLPALTPAIVTPEAVARSVEPYLGALWDFQVRRLPQQYFIEDGSPYYVVFFDWYALDQPLRYHLGNAVKGARKNFIPIAIAGGPRMIAAGLALEAINPRNVWGTFFFDLGFQSVTRAERWPVYHWHLPHKPVDLKRLDADLAALPFVRCEPPASPPKRKRAAKPKAT